MLSDQWIPERGVLFDRVVRRRLSGRLAGKRHLVLVAIIPVVTNQITCSMGGKREIEEVDVASGEFERLVIGPFAVLPESATDILIVGVSHRGRDVQLCG